MFTTNVWRPLFVTTTQQGATPCELSVSIGVRFPVLALRSYVAVFPFMPSSGGAETWDMTRLLWRSNAKPNGSAVVGVCGIAAPGLNCLSSLNVSMLPGSGLSRVTASTRPERSNPTWRGANGGAAASADTGSTEFEMGVIFPLRVNRKPAMLPLTPSASGSLFKTYSTRRCTVRLLGKSPLDDSTSTRFSPLLVSRNEVIVSLPALTAKTSLPLGVTMTSPWVSRIGQPPGGSQPGCGASPPDPPVSTTSRCFRCPLAFRLYTITALLGTPFVCE